MSHIWKFFISFDMFGFFRMSWYWLKETTFPGLLYNLSKSIVKKFICRWKSFAVGSSQSNLLRVLSLFCNQKIDTWVFCIINKSLLIITTLFKTISLVKSSRMVIVQSTSIISIIVSSIKAKIEKGIMSAFIRRYLISSKKKCHWYYLGIR